MKTIEKSNAITAYKAFNPDLTCNRFQFQIGKTYKHDGKIELCKSGFHSCLNPFDMLNYYDLTNVRFGEVKIWGVIDEKIGKNEDTKKCSEFIEIIREISQKEFADICSIYLAQNASSGDDAQNASSGYNAQNASSGYNAQNASSGYNAQNASSGENAKNASSGQYAKNASSGYDAKNASSGWYAKNASSGNNAQNASSGDNAQNASSGDDAQNASSGQYAQNVSSGDNAQNASSGNNAQNASSGDNAKNASSGNNAQNIVTGKNSVDANIGIGGKTKGIIGTWIGLAEYNDEGICICAKFGYIDGKKLKENVFYILKNKKFTIVK